MYATAWKFLLHHGPKIAGLLVVLMLMRCSYTRGQDDIQAEWNAERLVIAETERLAKIEADAQAREKNAAQRALEAELETANSERNRLRDENAQFQNRAPIVRTVKVPVEGVCHYPDVAEFVRVWNADASGTGIGAVSAANGEASTDRMPASVAAVSR